MCNNIMECSICFESKKVTKFTIFLKNNNVDLCQNNFKCIDNICVNCIINYIHNPILNHNCPLCRNNNFKYLDKIYDIYYQMRSIYKNIKIIYTTNNDEDIVNRIHRIFMYIIKSFDDYIKHIHNNDEYMVNYYLNNLESDIKDFKKIIKKLK